jgi:Na+-transporting NADH:ubiquinone oxidoreductase subunit NqrA
MHIPTKQMSENRGIPELVKCCNRTEIPKVSPLIQPQRTANTSFFPLVANAISAIDREIDVTKARLAIRVRNPSYSTGSTVCKSKKRKHKVERTIIKQRLLSSGIHNNMRQRPMPAPPILPHLQAGEKVSLG